jgi:signal transduction histidine kinase
VHGSHILFPIKHKQVIQSPQPTLPEGPLKSRLEEFSQRDSTLTQVPNPTHYNSFLDRWRYSFKAKLLLTYTLLWFALTLLTGVTVYWIVSASLQEKMGEQLLAMGKLVAQQLSGELSGPLQPSLPDSKEIAGLTPVLQGFLKAGVLQDITLLNPQDTVLLDATGEAVPGFKTPLLGQKSLEELGRNQPVVLPIHAGDFGLLHQSVFVPLPKGLLLQVDADPKSLEVLKKFKDTSLLLGLAGLFLSALVSMAVAGTVLKPVGTVVRLAEEVAQGRFPKDSSLATRLDELGQLERSILSMSDRIEARETELSRSRKEAENLAGQMKEIAGGIAHEVRNPLGIIRGEAEWIEKKSAGSPDITPAARKIQAQVKALNYLVTRFLEYSRAFKLDLKAQYPAEWIENLAQDLAAQAQKQAVQVAKEIRPCGQVEADSALISNALYNLGLNALQAMPAWGTLTLRLYEEGNFARIEVEDTGPGIPDDVLPKLFKPFFSTKSSGTGLGLAFTLKVVLAHGGKMEAFNRKADGYLPAGGAIFRVELPIVKGNG